MTNEDLIREIPSLPNEVKNKIGRIIEQFKKERASDEKPVARGPLREEPFFGMWKDREDMKDGGAAYIRRLRDEQWNRHRR